MGTMETVLIADDSKMIAKVIKGALLQNKIDGRIFDESTILTANDGLEALDKVSSNTNISLMISEVNMPHLDGDDLLEILMDTNRLKDTTIIFMTTKDKLDSLSDLAKQHAFGVIAKPFSSSEFIKSFNNLTKLQLEKVERAAKLELDTVENQKLILKILSRLIQKAVPKNNTHQNELPILIKEAYNENQSYTSDEIFSLAHTTLSKYLSNASLKKPLTKQHVIRSWMMETNYKVDVPKNPYKLALAFQKGVHDTKIKVEKESLSAAQIEKEIFGYVLKQLQKIDTDTNHITPINHKLFNPHYNALMKQFSTLDALFLDQETALAYAKLKEIVLFVDFNIQMYKKQELFKILPTTKSYKTELNNRVKMIVQKSTLLTNKLCTLFNQSHIKRANASNEIRHYLKSCENKFLPTTSNYFLHFNLITPEEYSQFPEAPSENVLLISGQKMFVERSRSMINSCFSSLNTMINLEVATKSKKAIEVTQTFNLTRVIVDFSFKDARSKNGLEHLQYLLDTEPSLKNLIDEKRLYVCMDDSEKKKTKNIPVNILYPFHILSKPLIDSELYDTMLFS
jgi:two-component system, chemotaxis family, chemotaxis protein CheY